MKKLNLVTGLLLGMGLAACNNTSTGIPAVGPLTPEQKARLAATADAVSDATQFKARATNVGASNAAAPPPTSEKRVAVLKTIDAQCQLGPEPIAVPTPQPQISIVKMRVASHSKNNDGACPVDFSWETTTTSKLNTDASVASSHVDIMMHYVPANDDAKAAFNSQSYDYTASIDKTVQNGSATYTGSGRGTAQVYLGNVWQSVSLTSVMTGTVSGSNQNFTYSYDVVYRDGLFVELKLNMVQTAAGQPMTLNCWINGVPVDQKEFMPYLAKLGFESRLPEQMKN